MSGRGLQARATQAPADVKTRAKARATQAPADVKTRAKARATRPALPRSAADVKTRVKGPRYKARATQARGGCQVAG
jgi:hypothetical protein